ncbi:MAG: ABC transporter permease [Chloroflexota bacterium]|nr:ABC transporter permease [Chloroflexota bacterium]
MLLRLVGAAVVRRRSRAATALAALAIGSAVISGLASVYYDTGQKMSRELRSYGANLVLTAASAEQPYISLETVSRAAANVDQAKLVGYVPYLYGAARLRTQDVVVVGTRFDEIGKVTPYWKIGGGTEAAILGSDSALVGEALAGKLGLHRGDRITLAVPDTAKTRQLSVGGILTTGGDEDSRLFVDLGVAGDLFAKPGLASAAYFSVVGSLSDLRSLAGRWQAQFPGLSASPVYRISKSEGQVLDKVKALVLLSVALILALTLLCVAITMTNGAMERRREVGLKRALGAEERAIAFEFVAEGSALGLTGGLLGWLLGLAFAQAVGQSVFQSSISMRPASLPLTLLLAGGLAALASSFPARAAARVDPATTLRGE